MNKVSENTATSSEDAKRQMQSEATASDQSKVTKPAPSEQTQNMTTGTSERTESAPSEQSKKVTAGAAQPAPSQKAADQGC
jgi:hypothetical protein